MICPFCERELSVYPLKKHFGAELAKLAMSKMGGSLAKCQKCSKHYILRNGRVDLDVTDAVKGVDNV